MTDKKEMSKRKEEIIKNGLDETILEKDDFQEFMGKFKDNTSLTDIYNLYIRHAGEYEE